MTILGVLSFFILSYLLGSVPSGLIIGKVFKKIDIREHGSKNTGATNAVRVLGFKYGIWAFIFDALKGAIVILILHFFNLTQFYMIPNSNIDLSMIYGLAATIGHVFPVYVSFKGGKAVATSAGVVLAIEPLAGIIGIVVFLITFIKSRYVSLSSTIGAAAVLLSFIIRVFIRNNASTYLLTSLFELLVTIILGLLIFFRHKSNYKRLKEGTENKF